MTLYEDKKQSSTGFINGKLTSSFIIDNKGKFRYDALMFSADGFSNNEFVGSWTSYKTNIAKKCNWGDYRIPDSSDLDIGTGEFSVNEKYVKNDWLSYMLESSSPNLAIKKEKSKMRIKTGGTRKLVQTRTVQKMMDGSYLTFILLFYFSFCKEIKLAHKRSINI